MFLPRRARPVLAFLLAALAVALSLVGPAGALGAYVPPGYKTPEFSGVAGEKSQYSATIGKEKCRNFGDVQVLWGDGKSDFEGAVVTVTETGSTVTFAGSHEYAAAGDYLGSVNFTATCTNNLGQDYHAFQKGTPGGYPMGFIVHVAQGKASFPPPKAAPKKVVPQPVKDYFLAKDQQLSKDAAFFCGDLTHGPTPSSVVSSLLFFPYCQTVTLKLIYYGSIVRDPPDSVHAGTIAFPSRVALPKAPKVNCKSATCAAALRAAKRFVAAAARVTSISRAMSASVDRFSGAGKLLKADATQVNRMRVLQAAAFRAWAGGLAQALSAQRSAGGKLASALSRAHLSVSTSDGQARKQAKRLRSLKGLPKSVLAAFTRAGVTRARLRQLFTAAAPFARGTSLRAALTRSEPTAALRRLSHTLTPVDIAYIENALRAAHHVTAARHAKLRKDLLNAAQATGNGKRTALRAFAKDARAVKGESGTLLRLCAQEAR